MKVRVIVLTLFAGLVTVEAHGQDAKGDLAKIKGDWSVTAMEMNGKESPKQAIEKITVTFTGEKFVLARGGKGKEYTFKLHPNKKPRAIDFVPLDGKSKGLTVYGIYELDGKDLKICMPNADGTERPGEFKTTSGSDLILMSLTPKK